MLLKLQLDKSYPGYRVLVLPGIISVAYLVMSFYIHSDYLKNNLNVYLGILITPYVFIVRNKGDYSVRFLILTVLLGIITILFPLRSLYFVCVAFAIILMVESCFGKLNSLAVIFLLVLSPVFDFLNSFFGVPARLKLSELVGYIMQAGSYQVKTIGNVILLNGMEFYVDPGCVGLNMLSISYTLGIFVIAYYERITGRKLSFLMLCVALAIISLLNIGSNLIRIITLVIFNLDPENSWHELTGLLCFAIYVVIPFVFIVRWLYHKFSKPIKHTNTILKISRLRYLNIPLAIAVMLIGFNIKKTDARGAENFAYTLPGYEKKLLTTGVVQFENKDALIYVKPIMAFYKTEHSPMICWTNNGYKFKRIEKRKINSTELYVGEMHKDKSIIYVSWWFDNGSYRTLDQLDWRWRVLKGEHNFYLINVNSSDENKMLEETKKILNTNPFSSNDN